MKYIITILITPIILFFIVAPAYLTVTMKPYEDCMRVYTNLCHSTWVCEWTLYQGHIEHSSTEYEYGKVWTAHWCMMNSDANIFLDIQNSIYCNMVYYYW